MIDIVKEIINKKDAFLLMCVCLLVLQAEGSAPDLALIRFSPIRLEETLIYYSETDMMSLDWVTVQKNGGSHTFSTDDNASNSIRNDVVFENFGPINGYTNAAYWSRELKVVCQWDEEEFKTIDIDEEVNGNLLQSYDYRFVPIDGGPLDDVDIYCFTPRKKAYCLEFSPNSDVKVSISSNGYEYNEYGFTNTTYAINSAVDHSKRIYKIDWIPNQTYYIKIQGDTSNTNYYKTRHYYKFTIKKVRPIVLIHGINSHPTDYNDKDTAFGQIRKRMSWLADIMPCYVFDYPWDAYLGVYTSYCVGSASLNDFINANCSQWDYNPIIFAHSMGGLLTLRQIQMKSDFLPKIDACVFFGTPFCGSDKASWGVASLLVSSENKYCLKRGTRHVWDILENIPETFEGKKKLVFYGTSRRLYVIAWGASSGDGVVSASSANLLKTLGFDQKAFGIKLNHINITEFKFPCSGQYKIMFNRIASLLQP